MWTQLSLYKLIIVITQRYNVVLPFPQIPMRDSYLEENWVILFDNYAFSNKFIQFPKHLESWDRPI